MQLTEIWWRERIVEARALPTVGAYARFGSGCRVGSARDTLYSLHQGEIDLYFLSYRSYPGFRKFAEKLDKGR